MLQSPLPPALLDRMPQSPLSILPKSIIYRCTKGGSPPLFGLKRRRRNIKKKTLSYQFFSPHPRWGCLWLLPSAGGESKLPLSERRRMPAGPGSPNRPLDGIYPSIRTGCPSRNAKAQTPLPPGFRLSSQACWAGRFQACFFFPWVILCPAPEVWESRSNRPPSISLSLSSQEPPAPSVLGSQGVPSFRLVSESLDGFSSSISGSSRLRSGKGFCADRLQNQTGNRRSAEREGHQARLRVALKSTPNAQYNPPSSLHLPSSYPSSLHPGLL